MALRGFNYTPDIVANLEATLSRDRLTKYLELAHNDTRRAIKIYVHNMIVSEALYGPLQGLEVALRNSFHRILSEAYAADWYDKVILEHPQRTRIDGCKNTLEESGKEVTPGQVVANLSFGFWTGILGRKYENTLWRPHLRQAFPNIEKLRRQRAQQALNKIRTLRNRVAHHEPIIHTNLRSRYDLLLNIISWMCPDTREWVAYHSRFERALEPNFLRRLPTALQALHTPTPSN